LLPPNCRLEPMDEPLSIPPSSFSPLPHNHHYALNFYEANFFYIPQLNKTMWYLSICAWLISLNIMISSSIHV
jgi:hypothetical protein